MPPRPISPCGSSYRVKSWRQFQPAVSIESTHLQIAQRKGLVLEMSKDVRSSFGGSKAGNPNLPQLLRAVRQKPIILVIGRNEHTTSYSASHPVNLSDRKLRKVQNDSLAWPLLSKARAGWPSVAIHPL